MHMPILASIAFNIFVSAKNYEKTRVYLVSALLSGT